jgi:HTH-type transcriptional regulator / antitoxin HipB
MKINSAGDLGKMIQEKRKLLNITQSDAAAMCNVGIRFFSEFENGKSTIQFDKALYAAKMMGIDLFAEDRNGDKQ